MKLCNVCGEEKNEGEFYKNDNTCKECRKAAVRKNRLDNAEHYKEYDRNRYREDPRVKERHKRYALSEAGKIAGSRAKKKYIERNTVKRAANIIVGNAVRDGKILKMDSCSVCGASGQRIHGHHDDYAKPLEVRWLCSKCHKAWHIENGEAKNGS